MDQRRERKAAANRRRAEEGQPKGRRTGTVRKFANTHLEEELQEIINKR